MDSTTAVGTVGAGILLVAFLFNQIGKWKSTDYHYDLANFVGSAILVIYATMLASWPFMILNAVWAGVSLRDMLQSINKLRG